MALSNGLTMAKVVPLIHMGRQPGKANVCGNSAHKYLGSISYVETIKTETSSMYHQFPITVLCTHRSRIPSLYFFFDDRDGVLVYHLQLQVICVPFPMLETPHTRAIVTALVLFLWLKKEPCSPVTNSTLLTYFA